MTEYTQKELMRIRDLARQLDEMKKAQARKDAAAKAEREAAAAKAERERRLKLAAEHGFANPEHAVIILQDAEDFAAELETLARSGGLAMCGKRAAEQAEPRIRI